jgi:hypothetical protein
MVNQNHREEAQMGTDNTTGRAAVVVDLLAELRGLTTPDSPDSPAFQRLFRFLDQPRKAAKPSTGVYGPKRIRGLSAQRVILDDITDLSAPKLYLVTDNPPPPVT